MDNQQGPTDRELCSVSCGSLDGREIWGRMNTCICMAESLSCVPDTITILLIGYTPIEIKSLNSKHTHTHICKNSREHRV